MSAGDEEQGILCRGNGVCNSPVAERIEASARVKDGWCDCGHGPDGQDEGEGAACFRVQQQLGGRGKRGSNEAGLVPGTVGSS